MKKKLLAGVLAVMMVLLLTSCGCDHEWQAATCTTAKTCSVCGKTEGEVPGHAWQEATCETAKTCTTCNITEGEALGHDWQEATTEAPKTCARCKRTEGERIITDPRFTTASTKFLHGTWFCDVKLTAEMLGLPMGFPDGVDCTLSMEFTNAGALVSEITLKDRDAFMDDYRDFTMEYTYVTLEQSGISRDQADANVQQNFGMTMEEYVEASLKSVNVDVMFAMYNSTEVYYVKDNLIYTALSWKSTRVDDSTYTLVNGVLTIDAVTLEEGGKPLQWTRQKNSSVLL